MATTRTDLTSLKLQLTEVKMSMHELTMRIENLEKKSNVPKDFIECKCKNKND